MRRILLANSAWRQLQGAHRVLGGVSRQRCPCYSHVDPFRLSPLYLDRTIVLPQRSFSSTNDEIDYYELERWTNRVLNQNMTRLGTMSPALVDDTIKSCQKWLSSGSGIDIDSADRLLKRLESEHASGSAAAQQRTDEIVDLQQRILQSWLKLSTFRMAAEKSKDILDTMFWWHERGFTAHNPLSEMVQVVEACLASFPDIAATILLEWTEVPRPETATELALLLNRALDMFIHEGNVETATMLLERMETLQTVHEWNDLVISNDARDFVANGPAILELRRQEAAAQVDDTVFEEEVDEIEVEHDSSENDSSIKHLSEFELQAKQDRFVQFLETATRADKPQVTEMVKKLHTQPETPATASLYKTLMDYFIRIEDAKNATMLLSRIDLGRDFEHWELNEDVFMDSLRLWVKSEHVDAAWRAQELVSRMEELEIRGLVDVSTMSYNLLCEAWSKSTDPAAPDKVENILSYLIKSRDNNVTHKAPDLDTFRIYLSVWPKDDDNLVAQVVSELIRLLHQGEELGKEDFSSIVDKSLESLSIESLNAGNEQVEENGKIAATLFRLVVSEGIPATPTMCINLLKAQAPFGALRGLTYLESLPDVAIPIQCYERAIVTLMDSRGNDFSQKKGMVDRMFRRYAKGFITGDPVEMEALMVRIIHEMSFTSRGRGSFVEGMLLRFEQWTLSDDAPINDIKVPIECFNVAMNAWYTTGRYERVAAIFDRLLGYYDAGESSLLPSTSSFETFLNVVLKTKAPPHETAKKATSILKRMIVLYETTGNAACRPNHGCFTRVLTALSKAPGRISASLALKILRRMQEMRLAVTTADFNKVMFAILQMPGKAEDAQNAYKFNQLCALLDEMKEAGVEPDHLTYKNMLRACMSTVETSADAVSVAMDAMGQLRKAKQADAGSYGLLVMALGRHLSNREGEKRRKVLSQTCMLCYEDGLMSKENAKMFRDRMGKQAWKAVTDKFNEVKASEQTSNSTGKAM